MGRIRGYLGEFKSKMEAKITLVDELIFDDHHVNFGDV